MGALLARMWLPLVGKAEVRIVMVCSAPLMLQMGLDDGGKTTIMYKTKLGEVATTMPTIGHKVTSQQYKNLNLVSFDVGGRDRVRPLWRHYWDGASAVIWVVDSGSGSSAWEHTSSLREFQNMLAEEQLKGLPLLILANKQVLVSLDFLPLALYVFPSSPSFGNTPTGPTDRTLA